jgi:hypothetical protein
MCPYTLGEPYHPGYSPASTAHHQRALDDLVEGKRHVFEAEMKALRRTQGREGHEATPEDAHGG